MPDRGKYPYTFANIADTIAGFTEAIGLKKFAIYIFDYGSPVGLRIALKFPERISAIVSQNGNAYEEGLSSGWNPIQAYWNDPSQANRDALRAFLKPESTTFQYTHGVADTSLVSPDGRSLDDFYLARPGADEIQLDLFKDYASNVALYPQFQQYFRKHQPPLLAVWGNDDPFFLPAAPKPLSAISQRLRSSSSTPAISRSKRTAAKSPMLFSRFWLKPLATNQHSSTSYRESAYA